MYDNTNVCGSGWHMAHRYIKTALLLVLVIAGVFLIRNWNKQYDYIGVPETRDMISVEGTGKVTALPDIATFSVGVQTEKSSIAEAQKENTDKMNKIVKAMKDSGIKDEDIRTSNYSIYPQYNYLDGRQSLRGYQVSQDVTVKVRDLSKVGDIFAKAGDLGANTVGSLQFTIDDPDQYKQEARVEAIKKAQEKARFLAKETDIKLGKIVSFYEYSPETPVYYDSMMKSEASMGMGGAMPAVAPSIQAGSSEITVTVNVSYEVLR